MTVGQEYWEPFYRDGRAAWSGNPNELIVGEVADLAPGTALDLGCGQGDDAIWLASQGWKVTAVDVSATAVALGADRAAAAGVAEAIEWQRHDLAVSFPSGNFDLVSCAYLHSLVDLPREQILRSAAAAVAPGGTLLVVGHEGVPTWRKHDHELHFPTPLEVLGDLALTDGYWAVRRNESVTRQMASPDGEPGSRIDNVLNVRRLDGSTAMPS